MRRSAYRRSRSEYRPGTSDRPPWVALLTGASPYKCQSLQVPRAAPRAAQQPVSFVIVEEPLVRRIPLQLTLQLEPDVPQDAQRGYAVPRLHGHDRLLARAHALLEVLVVSGTARHLAAVALRS